MIRSNQTPDEESAPPLLFDLPPNLAAFLVGSKAKIPSQEAQAAEAPNRDPDEEKPVLYNLPQLLRTFLGKASDDIDKNSGVVSVSPSADCRNDIGDDGLSQRAASVASEAHEQMQANDAERRCPIRLYYVYMLRLSFFLIYL